VGEEGDDRIKTASSKGVVGEVGFVERGVRFEGVAERTEREGNLGDETAGEDVGKVGDLCWRFGLVGLLHGINHVRWKMEGGRWKCDV
jgi:hypothetical protein